MIICIYVHRGKKISYISITYWNHSPWIRVHFVQMSELIHVTFLEIWWSHLRATRRRSVSCRPPQMAHLQDRSWRSHSPTCWMHQQSEWNLRLIHSFLRDHQVISSICIFYIWNHSQNMIDINFESPNSMYWLFIVLRIRKNTHSDAPPHSLNLPLGDLGGRKPQYGTTCPKQRCKRHMFPWDFKAEWLCNPLNLCSPCIQGEVIPGWNKGWKMVDKECYPWIFMLGRCWCYMFMWIGFLLT